MEAGGRKGIGKRDIGNRWGAAGKLLGKGEQEERLRSERSGRGAEEEEIRRIEDERMRG